MISEDLDLAEVTRALKAKLGPGEPVGYLRGKSLMRDLLVRSRGFSELEAEELVDTLEERGYLHFRGDPAARSRAEAPWDVRPDAESPAAI
ncbi:MAG: hypothetical protein ACYC8T_24655 [Myxococcaceae bacterium]